MWRTLIHQTLSRISRKTTTCSPFLMPMQFTSDKILVMNNVSLLTIEKSCIAGLFFSILFFQASAQDLRLLDWKPKSQLVVKRTDVAKPKFPVIDIHNHLGELENTETYL